MADSEFIFGANILDNLTTGMYRNPLVSYREYIQNACDSIDHAVDEGILSSVDQGKINIWLDSTKRVIEIEDNGIGIPMADFRRVLGNIADSDKTLGEDKGFRGIGRLCGLAYCKRLCFYAKYKGETKMSILYCDAEKMRTLLDKHQKKQKKYLAADILTEIYTFAEQPVKNVDEHYFRVVLENVDTQNNNLLDILQVKDYLSFVAPVSYQNSFYYRNKIYAQSKLLNQHIDEYSIKVNGEDIFKKYVTILKDKNGVKYDDISDVSFHSLFNEDGELIAWMWIGIIQFKQAIPKINVMRGIRLRKENIQIGDEDAIQKLFKEDRGNSYFIGEIFALDNNLIPNSQRDYFNQNKSRASLEIALKEYFDTELYKTYNLGSQLNSGYKKIEKYEALVTDYATSQAAGFAGAESKALKEQELRDAQIGADKARSDIQKKMGKVDPESLLGKVANIIKQTRNIDVTASPSSPIPVASTTEEEIDIVEGKRVWRVDKLSQYNKQERKLIGRIFDVIFTVTDKETAEKIVNKIEEALR